MPKIHPLAVIEPGAKLADDVEVGPFCHVGPKVKIGAGTRLISNVSIYGRTTIGSHNTLWPHVVLGGDPQDLKFKGEDSQLIIGDHNDLREGVTIHKGTAADHNITRVGDHNLIMAYVHVGHDCVLGSHLVIANAVQLAGHILIEDHAVIGGATAIHHWVAIRQYAFVAGMTRIVQDVPPFMIVEGMPARVRKVNTVLLKRHHFPQPQINALKEAHRLLFGGVDEENHVGNMTRNLETLEAKVGNDWALRALLEAVRESTRGIFGRHREAFRQDNRYTNPVR
ncbi:acyl-ACP--UDP-N-acetylglucosamine O-acyltransferase [Phycisphaerales bacterium AB-hyl4]|uniref:Acyl-ACP--UDP-N-acetylglucosamine O-acyltransferase n=1 Tax=Natronomicrosphaera hydrolytica TaxID=3242702 RepID=A0ABV4TZM7_9BACT